MNVSDAHGDLRVNVSLEESEYIEVNLEHRGTPVKGFLTGFSFSWRRPYSAVRGDGRRPAPYALEVQPRGQLAKKDGSIGQRDLHFAYDFDGFSVVPPKVLAAVNEQITAWYDETSNDWGNK